MPLRDIFVITHTESIHHVKQLGGGWFDTSLTDKGQADARRIASSLFDRTKTRGIPILSSDLKRCSEMAAIFQGVFSGPCTTDPRLREMSCGEPCCNEEGKGEPMGDDDGGAIKVSQNFIDEMRDPFPYFST